MKKNDASHNVESLDPLGSRGIQASLLRSGVVLLAAIWSLVITPQASWLWGPLWGYLGWSFLALLLIRIDFYQPLRVPLLTSVDVLAVTYYVHCLGSQDTVMVMLYVPILIAFSVQRSRTLTLISLLGMLVAYLFVLVAEESGLLTRAPIETVSLQAHTMIGGAPLAFFVTFVTLVSAYGFITSTVIRFEKQAERERQLVAAERAAIQRSETLQQRVHELERLESLGRLAGGIAHDFNNLLTVIQGSARFVETATREKGEVQQDVKQILAASDRAAKLTAQLLTFGRKQVISTKRIDLMQVVRVTESELRDLLAPGVELRLPELDTSDALFVKADEEQVKRVFTSLVLNSVQAMPDGGAVHIEMNTVELDESHCESRPPLMAGQHVRIVIGDTGVGMDPETLHRAFEPFFTTRSRSLASGLGLSSAYGMVTQLGGHIELESTQGAGTVVTLHFPSSPAPVDVRANEQDQPSKERSQGDTLRRILVVEDEHMVRRVAARILARAGYKVIEAANGEQALKLLNEQQGQFSLLLTDIVMPGISGIELAAEVSAHWPSIPKLYMSGYAEGEWGPVAAADEETGFLPKPFTSEALIEAVESALNPTSKRPQGIAG